MSLRICLAAAACLLAWAGVAPAAPIPSENQTSITYYTDPNVCRGWFCYEDSAPMPEPEADQQLADRPAPPVFTGQVDWDAVWTMHPDAMRELINQAMAYAQQNPRDEERMVTYLKLQGVAMRRAKMFQETWASAILKYPILDSTVQRAPTLAATNAEIIAEREDRSQAINEMRQNMGILYFYSPTCRYCTQQKTILANFVEKWNWRNITAINILESPEAAREYGVQAVPDIWLAGNFNGKTVQRRLKSGLVEFSGLERGILQAWSFWSHGTRYERPAMIHQLNDFDDFLKQGNDGGKP